VENPARRILREDGPCVFAELRRVYAGTACVGQSGGPGRCRCRRARREAGGSSGLACSKSSAGAAAPSVVYLEVRGDLSRGLHPRRDRGRQGNTDDGEQSESATASVLHTAGRSAARRLLLPSTERSSPAGGGGPTPVSPFPRVDLSRKPEPQRSERERLYIFYDVLDGVLKDFRGRPAPVSYSLAVLARISGIT
jgi:hypothetical protein